MRALLFSNHWLVRLTRIAVLAAIGWWAVEDIVRAQVPSAFQWPKTNFEKTLVDLDEIMSGGPPKDGIPSIDSPKFVAPASAADWIDPREPVIVLVVNKDARAYPLQILTWHEIVNDTVGGVPVSVTFCPLCNASIVFDRRVGTRVLDFGTTGRLRKSDMVMYDRQTESWWQQISGRAIVGDLAGTVLEKIPASIVAFEDFRKTFPNARVLSRETGHRRAYGRNPYAGYDSIDQHPFLFSGAVDPRLPAMERVLNVSIDATHRVYPYRVFEQHPVINDTVSGVPVAIFSRDGTLSALDTAEIAKARIIASASAWNRRLDGRVLEFRFDDGGIVDRNTGSRWSLLGRAVSGPLIGRQLESVPGGVHFAFAWLAFHPQSEIYRP